MANDCKNRLYFTLRNFIAQQVKRISTLPTQSAVLLHLFAQLHTCLSFSL